MGQVDGLNLLNLYALLYVWCWCHPFFLLSILSYPIISILSYPILSYSILSFVVVALYVRCHHSTPFYSLSPPFLCPFYSLSIMSQNNYFWYDDGNQKVITYINANSYKCTHIHTSEYINTWHTLNCSCLIAMFVCWASACICMCMCLCMQKYVPIIQLFVIKYKCIHIDWHTCVHQYMWVKMTNCTCVTFKHWTHCVWWVWYVLLSINRTYAKSNRLYHRRHSMIDRCTDGRLGDDGATVCIIMSLYGHCCTECWSLTSLSDHRRPSLSPSMIDPTVCIIMSLYDDRCTECWSLTSLSADLRPSLSSSTRWLSVWRWSA